MNESPDSLKALKKGTLGEIAGGGVYQGIINDKYGTLAEMSFICDKCGKKVNPARISDDERYETLCDECHKKMKTI